MTRDQEIVFVRDLLAKLQQCRNSTAENVTDDSRDKQEILAGLDSLVSRARAHLARLDATAPLTAASPEALQ